MKINKLVLFVIFFLTISTAAWATASPVIFYSDLTAGPNTGGQNNFGVFVTIWGNNFGSTQGSSSITVGGGKVNNYPTWTNTMICFQLGANAATGNIVLNTSSGNATGPVFTVQAGNIYFVQPGAATNGTGTYASPFNHLYYAYQVVAPGDTTYVESGTIFDQVEGYPNWHTLFMPLTSGTSTAPISWIAYPNATATLKADGGTTTWTDGSSGGTDNIEYIFRGNTATWQTFSKFYLVFTGTYTSGLDNVADSNGEDGWKFVGNNLTASYYEYCQICIGGANGSALGNTIHDSGSSIINGNEAHSIYVEAGANPFEVGWNYMYNNENSGWEISNYHNGPRIGTIHDNLIIASAGAGSVKGILVDGCGDTPSPDTLSTMETNVVKAYNNVIINAGQLEAGGAMQANCGTNYIYNNTIYGSGTETSGVIQFEAGGIGPGGGNPVEYVANNIIVGNNPGLYLSDAEGNAPAWTNFALLTNNNYYGEGNGPTQDTSAINANPQFVSPSTSIGGNFQLQSTSPDINAGYNTISIVAIDLNGLLRGSTPSIGAYEYSASTSVPSPVVAITSPTSGSSVSTGSNVTITATASEAGGSITNISIYNGTTLLGSSSSSPYNYVMTDPAAGNYTLTARATDAKGVSTTSSFVTMTVTSQSILPSSPAVTITSPTSGSSFTAGSNVTVTTTASETNGTIRNISLYNGSGLLLGSNSSSPYNFVDTNMAAGAYSFYAVATDVNGVSTTSGTITITITGPSLLPIVNLTAPSSNAVFTAPATVFLSADASETNGTITQVQFFNGTTLLGTATSSPYNYTGTTLPSGSYIFTAQATDNRGVVAISAPVIIIINSQSSKSGTNSLTPAVAITNPGNGSSITAGSNLNITASASETNGSIAEVYFYNGSTFLGSDSTAPYNFTWANVPAGNHTLTATAIDASGVSVTSSPVTITAASTAPPAVPPTVSITSPANGNSFTAGSNLNITANASETNGTIAQVQFYNGSTLLGTDSTSPYTFSLNNISAGSYTLTAKATDTTGVSTTSSPVTVTVTTPAVPPVVSITGPANGSNFTAGSNISITANASETNGSISEVYFYNGTTFLGSDSTSPYTFNWTNVPAGSYSLIAVAIDVNGVSVSSNAVSVTVTAPAASPVVSITSPGSGSTYTAGSNVTITATASETNGTIKSVSFYNGTTLLKTRTSSPYSYTWSNVSAGSYTLTAKATDANGVSVTSAPITITVNPQSSLPTVSLTAPSNNAVITAPAILTLSANASETNGTITQVQFFNGSTLLATDTTSPYTYAWSMKVAAGTYTLTAQATDSNGVVAISAPVVITFKTS